MLATSVALPMELLRAAESLSRTELKNKSIRLNIQLASLDGKPVTTHTGVTLAPDCAIQDISNSHITYLPALWRNPKPVLKRSESLFPWLKQQHRLGNTIAGVGTGCCFMGEASLLDHQPATTHWYYFDEFEKSYPLAELKRYAFITRAGSLFCTGSVTSLADLTVFFIEELFHTKIARDVERHFFHEVRQAYQLQHHTIEEAYGHPDEAIAQAQTWLSENLMHEVQIKTLAAELKMSLRTLNRRFKQATNQTPLQYLQTLRMRQAREFLQSTNLSIAEIAYKIGYLDTAHFSDLFKKHFATTPGQYRTTVRAKLFHADT